MLALLKKHYAGLFALPLETAGPGEVSKWFSDNGTQSTAKRSQAFFIRAAREYGIPLHSMVAKSTPTASGGKAGQTKRRGGKRTSKKDDAPILPIPSNGEVIGITDKLLSKFPAFDPQWDATVQEKWFETPSLSFRSA